MVIAATGPLRTGAIRTEYGGTTPMRLGNYRRGNAAGWVKINVAGNASVNGSAAVGTAVLRMSQFRGQKKGWTYTNTTVRTNNFYIDSVFGTDWSVAWPKAFINNATIGATTTGYYACIINGGTGGFTFTNNAEIQGAGGATPSAVGQHALLIQNTAAGANRPIITNNAAIRGGGGAGGNAGAGGTGGQGYYDTAGTLYEPASGFSYLLNSTEWNIYGGNQNVYWGGPYLGHPPTIGAYTYYQGNFRESTASGANNHYEIRRTSATSTRTYTTGGGGGAGGTGGRGIGYGAANVGGTGGAAGAGGGTNAGSGGYGGTGGTGGTWGTVGNTGNTGATGNTGNYTGGTAGAAGAAGGAKGFAINATSPWGLAVAGTLSGSYTGTAPT